MTQAVMHHDELLVLHNLVERSLERRDLSALNVLGLGEMSIALGWPIDDPTIVCKRTPVFTAAQFAVYKKVVSQYVADVEQLGISVVDTIPMCIENDDQVTGYLVQEKLPSDTLGHHLLASTAPDSEHPFLLALGSAISTVTERLSIDAQVSNWSWDGSTLTLIDVGTPFAWDASGDVVFDMGPFAAMISKPFRPIVRNDLTKVLRRWQTPRGVAVDIVANLHRVNLENWIAPSIEAFNQAVSPEEPITATEARVIFDEDLKTFPRLKKLQQIERTWQTKVRRKTYPFFIQNSFDGSII